MRPLKTALPALLPVRLRWAVLWLTALWLAALWLAALAGHAGADAVLSGRTLSFQDDAGRTVWSRNYPQVLGPLTGPLRQEGLSWLAVGPALFAYADDGEQRTRLDFPADISALDAGGGLFRVVTGQGSVQDTFTVSGLQVQERVVFPPDPALTGWLRRAADAVPQAQLSAVATADPDNPFLALRLARLAQLRGDRFGALAAAQRSVSAALPFPASVQLAQGLDTAGYPAAADLALDRARRDWARRGYDPALPVDRAALQAWGDPLGYLGVLLSQNRLRRADAWLRYLREVSPRFSGYPEVYDRYADLLDGQGRSGEADEWRQFSRSLAVGTLYNLGPGALPTVRDAARLTALALALAVLVSVLSLAAHYRPQQRRDLVALGGGRALLLHPLSRVRRSLLSYAAWGERLGLSALLLGLLLALSSWGWSERVGARIQAPVLNVGTYGGSWFYDGLDRLALGGSPADAALIRGLALQLDGDPAQARTVYEGTSGAPGPCILNNLGALAAGRADLAQARDLYRRALAADPTLVAPAYNLGLNPSSPEASFQAALRRTQPMLCYPDQQTLSQAVDPAPGSSALGLLKDPLGALTGLPTGLPRPLQWAWALLLLSLLAASVLWLVLPRLPEGDSAGRPILYRLLALTVPGSSLLDGAWGTVLLLAFTVCGSLLLARAGVLASPHLLSGAPAGLGAVLLGLLAGLYLINTLAFVLSELGQRR